MTHIHSTSLLDELARPFHPHDIQSRQQGKETLLYASIDVVQDRLDEVLGLNWEVRVEELPLAPAPGTDRNGNPNFLAQVRADLTIEVDGRRITRSGLGAHVGSDLSMLSKSALADAIKKAATQFGIGRELWSTARRIFVDKFMNFEQMTREECGAAMRSALWTWLGKESMKVRDKDGNEQWVRKGGRDYDLKTAAGMEAATRRFFAEAKVPFAGNVTADAIHDAIAAHLVACPPSYVAKFGTLPSENETVSLAA